MYIGGLHINYPVFMSGLISTHYSCQILFKLKFSWWIFEKYWYQISWKSIHWEPSCFLWMEVQTDRHD